MFQTAFLANKQHTPYCLFFHSAEMVRTETQRGEGNKV